MFPEVRDDPDRNDFGSVTEYPPPFARGGGLFPVLALLDDGRLCCAFRTGATTPALPVGDQPLLLRRPRDELVRLPGGRAR